MIDDAPVTGQERVSTSRSLLGRLSRPEVICLVLLALYVLTAQPSLGWRDNPEFADTTWTLGIAHPAGFPTFSLLTKVITFLPLGGIPFRIALASAFFGVLSLYLLYGLIYRSAGESTGEAGTWAAALATAVLGLGSALWTNAAQIEVYTLNLFFLGVLLYCALRWSSEGNAAWLYGGAFLYGLAAGNHATVAFFLPGLLIYVIGHSKGMLLRRLAGVGFFFGVGFLVYLYLPIRAAAEPALNFGDPETWERFFSHITNQKSTGHNFAGVKAGYRVLDYIWVFISKTIPRGFWPVGLPLFLIGLWRVCKTNWPLAAALALIGLSNLVFFIDWPNPTAFLPTFYVVTLLAGVGAAWLMDRWRFFSVGRARLVHGALAVCLAALVGAGLWFRFPVQNRSQAFLSLETFRTDFEALPPDAITISGILWFHHRAFQDIYRLREDVTVMGRYDFLRPEWFDPITKERFPRVSVPPDPFDRAAEGEYLKRFLAANLDDGRDIYWEPFDLDGGCFYPNLKPELELLFRVTSEPVKRITGAEIRAAIGRLQEKLKREIEREGFVEDEELHDYYISLMLHWAGYYNSHRHPEAAKNLLELMDNLFGPAGTDTMLPRERGRINTNLGTYLVELKRFEEAQRRFEIALEMNRYDSVAWANLGQVHLKQGRLDRALPALQRALALNPDFPEALYIKGEYHRAKGELSEAGRHYRRAMELIESDRVREKIRKRLDSLEPGQTGVL